MTTDLVSNERVVPYSLEAERALLGSLMIRKDSSAVLATLREDDFFREAHRIIYAAMRQLAADGVAIDPLTVGEHLRTTGEIEEVGGFAYLSSLTDGVPSSSNSEHYAAIIRERAALRRLIHEASSVLERAYDAKEKASSIASEAARNLRTATSGVDSGKLVSSDEILASYGADLADGKTDVLRPTGLKKLDGYLGGLREQDLVIVAGRPGAGKTSFTIGIADALAARGEAVLVISLEMQQAMIARSLASQRGRVNVSSIERGVAHDSELERLGAVLAKQDGRPLYFAFSARTIEDVAIWCHRAKQEHHIVVACIDYLQLLVPAKREASREREVAEISRGLKLLAQELGITVVALSQLNRAPESRKDKRPSLTELRESGALEQDADVVVLLFREEMYNPTPENSGLAEAIVAKHRGGPVGTASLAFLSQYGKFANLAIDQ